MMARNPHETAPDAPRDNPKKRGSRLIGGVIILLIVLFFAIEVFIRESQQFSPTGLTNILLSSLQIIVLLLGLVLAFILGRNLVRLYLERRRKVVGSHFKTKLVFFFIALSFIPTLLLFLFASDFISRNIEYWFQTPLDRILDDTKSLADGYYISNGELTLHYAQQLSRTIMARRLARPENRIALKDFTYEKLKEYGLDEISVYLDEEELFSWLNPNLPLQDYRELKANMVKRAQLGEDLQTSEPMGAGQMIRRGLATNVPEVGSLLIVCGRFLPQNYAQRIANISSYVQRYQLGKQQKNPLKTFYLQMLVFLTLMIIFAASWIGFHLAKGITVPIEKLAQATREVSRGNLDVRVEDPASDEIGTLIESFNQMIHDLGESRASIVRQTAELESRKRYTETLLESIATGVIALDAAGRVTTFNPSARDMLMLDAQDLAGRSYREVLEAPRYADLVKLIDGGMKSRYTLADREVTVTGETQVVNLAVALSPLRRSGGEFGGLIVVLDNLTQLIKVQKIAAWKEVAQRVAHEIKNPLTPIQLSAERIIRNLQKSGQPGQQVIAAGAEIIVQEARTIKSLVDEFSNFARLPKVQLQAADIKPIVEQAVALFRGIFADIEFEVEFGPGLPSPLQLDPEQMKRAIINIVDNGIEAMNKSGKVTIRTRHDPDRHRVDIAISDSGPGITVEDKAKLFMPHYSTKKKGTGLGLAIVSQIVRDHNGSVDVDNVKPHGATFTIHLPA
jgi:two-component system nitrogen regulation sensor histidine kinase NtrY